MSASSINRKVADDVKQKKVERRHAIEKGGQQADNQQQHQEAEIGGVSAETSGSDSPVVSEVKKAVAKKGTAKKKSAKKASAKKA